MTDDQRFEGAIREFADAIAANFALPVVAQPEDQLKEHVATLLRACGEAWGFDVRSRSEAQAGGGIGRPDIGVATGGLLCGYVELKAPGHGARPERSRGRDREQWERFEALPNLIYTDGSEWSLYRSGKRVGDRVRIAADVSEEGAAGLAGAALPKLAGLLRDFLMHEPVTPRTARGLAEFLAPLARLLRDEVREALDREGSAVRQIANEWRGVLFADADAAQFADAYAQTLTYALLLARFEGAENLRQALAVDALRQSEHDLLATALDLLETARAELAVPINLLERAIGVVNARALLAERGRQGAFNPSQEIDRDPWLYFYEHFLGVYDPALRRDRGVYFTPVEVVRAQVRFAHELLRDRFNKPTGFADRGVEVLDPACGTGTYPLAVLEQAVEAVRERFDQHTVPERLRDLAGRLHAFEILVGPYAVAQLRLTQRLRELGVTDRNPLVYLADTLESPNLQSRLPHTAFYEPLTREHERAQRVKRETRIFVCLGNPPYDREQHDPDDEVERRKGGWVRYGDEDEDAAPLLETFLAPVIAAGGGVHLKNLYNDYVYFWRWALWKVFDLSDDGGIVTFITASSYLRGPAFAGMRRKMREVFDELWIIDLEGDALGARKTENVFAIRTPVAIAIGVRDGKPDPDSPVAPARVRKVRLTGTEQEKLGRLDAAGALADFDWRECAAEWDAPFMPAEVGGFFDWPALTDVFPWQHSGAQFKRTWPIGETAEVLADRWRALLEHAPEGRAALFRETRDRTVRGEYPRLVGDGRAPPLITLGRDQPPPEIVPYAYRSLDRQFIVRDARVGDFCRPPLHRAHGEHQTYITGLLTKVLGTGPAAVATAAIPDLDSFCGRGAKDIIPLYRDAEASEPNVTRRLLERIAKAHGAQVTAERLFAYAYGVLAQPAYVERFWDELEQPPPRLPVTKDPKLFTRVADLGERLLHLHTYGERFSAPDRPPGAPRGEARNTKAVGDALPDGHSYDADERVLRVGEGEFAPVSPEVYGYSVSGFHVVKSWLDRRKLKRSGRKSSDLDEIRPERWEFTGELLELLWVLEATLRLEPKGAALLDEVCASDLFTADELPKPTDAEREAPGVARQGALFG